jgi:arylsulfatase A-like enzyme
VSAYGYGRPTTPNLDRLAAQGVLFRRAVSPSGWTLPAHASLFTGLRPSRHGATHFGFTTPIPLRFETLAERLWNAGYDTAGFTDGLFVSASLHFDQGFDLFDDSEGWSSNRHFRQTTSRGQGWIDDGHQGAFFLFLHTYEAHLPYRPPAQYQALFDPGYHGRFAGGVTDEQMAKVEHGDKWITDAELPHLEALYDGAIRSVDDGLGQLLTFLDAHGLTKSTCVVVTSDHGEEFREHGDLFHDRAKLYGEIVDVPLIISCPGRFPGGRVVDTPVGSIDVMPTLLELAGVPVGPGLDARSLVPALSGQPFAERPIISECDGSAAGSTGAVRAASDGSERLIESTVPSHRPRQLFDLATDPAEQHDLSAERPEAVARLTEAFGMPPPAAAIVATSNAAAVDPATRERMRALGYHE